MDRRGPGADSGCGRNAGGDRLGRARYAPQPARRSGAATFPGGRTRPCGGRDGAAGTARATAATEPAGTPGTTDARATAVPAATRAADAQTGAADT